MSDPLEAMRDLLVALGPATRGIAGIVEAEGPVWGIALDDGRQLVAEPDAEAGSLTLSVGLGQPPAAERLRVLETALLYNGLWRETGGLRFSMAGPEAELTLSLELPLALDLGALQAALALVAEKGAVWRGFVAGAEPPPAAPQGAIHG